MKAKALQHVDIQKRMRRESEERLERELRHSEELLEELRDNTATLVISSFHNLFPFCKNFFHQNVEHQEKVRMLKQTLSETEQQRAAHYTALQDLMASTACSMALGEIVS